jgi:hypothetical protein
MMVKRCRPLVKAAGVPGIGESEPLEIKVMTEFVT